MTQEPVETYHLIEQLNFPLTEVYMEIGPKPSAHRTGPAGRSSIITGITRISDMTGIQIASTCVAGHFPTIGTRIISESVLVDLYGAIEQSDRSNNNNFTVVWNSLGNQDSVACHVGLRTDNPDDYLFGKTSQGFPTLYLKRSTTTPTGMCVAFVQKKEAYLAGLQSNLGHSAEIERITNSVTCKHVLRRLYGCPAEADAALDNFFLLHYGLSLANNLSLSESDPQLATKTTAEIIAFVNAAGAYWRKYAVVSDVFP